MTATSTVLDRAVVDPYAIRDFLVNMYQDASDGYIVASRKLDGGPRPKYANESFAVSEIDDAVEYLARHAEDTETYIGIGLRRALLPPGKRGGKKEVLSVPSIWLDIDYGDEGHEDTEGLAPDLAAALAIVHALPLEPTVIVHTGGGLHVHWCFYDPAQFTDAAEQEALVAAWETLAKSIAAEQGYPNAVDSVHNRDRILRVPGTLNHKLADPRPVTIIEADWDRGYMRWEIECALPYVDEDEDEEPVLTTPEKAVEPTVDAGGFASVLSAPSVFKRYNVDTKIVDLIEADGARYLETDDGGRKHYVRPGKEAQEPSGNVLHNVLVVHSTRWTVNGVTLKANSDDDDAEKGAYTPSRYTTETRHGGDYAAFAASLDDLFDNHKSQPGESSVESTERVPEARAPVIVSSPSEPLPNAHKFVADNYAHPERELLMHHGGSFEAYSGTCWPEIEGDGLKAQLWNYFGEAVFLDAKNKAHPFKPNRDRVGNLVDALKAATHQPKDVTAPAWLQRHAVPADEIVALGNGLLHVPTRTLLPHTPSFYTNWALPFAYDHFAPLPTKWLAFLNDLFDDDDELKQTLQELFGYLISNDTRQQKIFNLIGPKRGGKGVIARVSTGLLGADNVAAPTLSSLSTEFGLQPLIGKPLALIADARLRAQDERIVERMLTISGEDSITIPRKHVEAWTGRLPTRFVLISNEIPRLRDASGALAARVILIPFTRSFYGREDPDLTDKLLAELPGILNWSLDGLDRLRTRGRFVQPKAAAEIVREMEDLGSPISAFVRDQCVLGAERTVVVELLYLAWRNWCNVQGIDRPGDVQSFGRDLRAALPGVLVVRPRVDGNQIRCYQGIGLRETR